MNRSFYLICILFIFVFNVSLEAQEQRVGMSPEIRRRSLVLDISARVLENEANSASSLENNEIWYQSLRRIVIPGSPTSIQLVGTNIVVAVQFTPFVRRNGNVLVAQGQIWINDPENGITYHTSIQTIPMEFNEPIYFFPLGQQANAASIEIVITVNPYRETANTENEN
ncbi:MAG: hypothetical protein FWD14_05445 [Treponema sp.]|nr:hypothetical protein [Treponema sp.]